MPASATSRRLGRPTRAAAAEIGSAVLTGAREVFCDQGFAAAGMNEIAAAVGVSKLTIYRRYPSKEALLIAVVDHHLAELMVRVDAARSRDVSSLEALRQTARALFDSAIEPDSIRFARLLIGESIRSDFLNARFADWQKIVRAPLVDGIVAAQAAGEIAPADPEMLSATLADLMDGLPHRLRQRAATATEAEATRFFEERWGFFTRGACARG